MSEGGAVGTLMGLRMAIGVGAWATPRLAGRLFGLDAGANPQSPYLARLFGVRDVALGWGIMGTEGDARRQWITVGIACDVADALAGLAAGLGGYLPRRTSALVTVTALGAAALGASALHATEASEANAGAAGV